MVEDILTKFNNKKRVWLTPKHCFYLRSEEFKKYYGAALFLQAGRNKSVDVQNNSELERILKAGLGLSSDTLTALDHLSQEESEVLDRVSDEITTERDKIIFMLDLLTVSYERNGWSADAESWIDLWERVLGIYTNWSLVLRDFIRAAREEDVAQSEEETRKILAWETDLTIAELKFYFMPLGKEEECTQQLLEDKQELRIVDRCEIHEDLVLRSGMKMIIDHAEVRIYGNIALEGGELLIEHSKIIRKSGSHRACINIRNYGGKVVVKRSEADCRNYGMFIRAEFGDVIVKESRIYQTTRGAAIRFWGNSIRIERSSFSECYSPEDGGALMIRGGNGEVSGCYFRDCEAKQGGAIYSAHGIAIHHCRFQHCCVAEYGAAIYYNGMVGNLVHHLEYHDCYPSGAETVQYLYSKAGICIKGSLHICVSTILDCALEVESQGRLEIEKANLYLNYQIRCRGSLKMQDVKVLCRELKKGDMIVLSRAKPAEIIHCDFDGRLRTGAISAQGTRIKVWRSIFRNTKGGRAIYDAYAPEIQDSIFNFCQDGAIYAQGGTIRHCVFINCREKNGAGIRMYGTKGGLIEQCNFKRCVADSRGGAIDRGIGHKVVRCLYESCSPDNIS